MKRRELFMVVGVILAVLAAVAVVAYTVEHVRRTEARAAEVEDTETLKGKESVIPVKKLKLAGGKYTYEHMIDTYLILGTDGSGDEEAVGEEYLGSMADVLDVLVIDHTAQTYAILQLNRDTITEVTLMTKKGETYASAEIQLCTAHWYGGDKVMSCENTIDAVSRLLGKVKFDGYYALSMANIQKLNHMVGGVTVTVEGDFSKVDPALVEGETIKLTDEQAEEYVRGRMEVGDGENLSRMSRQRQYMSAFLSQLREAGAQDADTTYARTKELLAMATTDLTEKTASGIANYFYKYDNRGIYTIDGESAVGQRLDDGIDHAEYYLDEDSLVSVMTELYGLVPYEE